MRLRDMLAAAVRPYIRVHADESTIRIDLGEKVAFVSRWTVHVRDAGYRHTPNAHDFFVRQFRGGSPVSVPRDVPLFGDLRIGWNSRRRFEREAEEWRAKRGNVDLFNDSKAAA